MKKNSAHSLFLLLAIFILPTVNNLLISQDVKEGLQSYESVFEKLDFRQLNVGTIIHITDNNKLQFLSNQDVKQKKYWFNKKVWSNKPEKDYKKMQRYKNDETIILDGGNRRPTNAQVYYFDKITSSAIINSKASSLKFVVKTEGSFSNPQDLFAIIKLHVRKGNKLFQKRPRRCIYKHGTLGLKNYGPYPNFVHSTFENVEYISFNAISYLKNAYLLTINSSDLPAGEYCIQNGESMEYQLFTIK